MSTSDEVQGRAARGKCPGGLGREQGVGWVPVVTRLCRTVSVVKGPRREDTLQVQAKEPLVGGVEEGAEVRSLGLQGAFPPHPGLGSEPHRQRDLP